MRTRDNSTTTRGNLKINWKCQVVQRINVIFRSNTLWIVSHSFISLFIRLKKQREHVTGLWCYISPGLETDTWHIRISEHTTLMLSFLKFLMLISSTSIVFLRYKYVPSTTLSSFLTSRIVKIMTPKHMQMKYLRFFMALSIIQMQ